MSSQSGEGKIIQLLQQIQKENIIQTAALPPGGGTPATEATLLSVLANIIDTQDLEIKLVRDTGATSVVVQQIRSYDQGTEVWTTTYEEADGTPYVFVGGPEYLDASAVLNLILAEMLSPTGVQPVSATALPLPTGAATEAKLEAVRVLLSTIDADTSNLDVALSTVAKDSTLITIDAVLDAIKLDTANISADQATQTTLELVRLLLVGIDVDTDAIATSTAAIDTKLAGPEQDPVVTTVSNAASIAAGFAAVTVENVGDTDGTLLGAIFPPGKIKGFSSTHINGTLGAIAYVATGTTFEITTLSAT